MSKSQMVAVKQQIKHRALFVCLVAFIPIGGLALAGLALGHALRMPFAPRLAA